MRVAAILIAGPTASGKSAVALRLARKLHGAIINTDSMQVYRDLSILTARPQPSELDEVPHFLFGHVDGAVNYSVGAWLNDCAGALAAVRRMDRLPILVGGTGLYFKALTEGISDIPPVPEAVRANVRARAEGKSIAELHAELALDDPLSAARLRPSDPQRILRALEVFAATGRSLTTFQTERQAALVDAQTCLCMFLAPERISLYQTIDARFDAMIRKGALAEVEALAKRQLDPLLPIMRAHGVPHLISFINGSIDLVDAAKRGKLDTRHYAKRQSTFARHQLPQFSEVSPETADARILAAFGDEACGKSSCSN